MVFRMLRMKGYTDFFGRTRYFSFHPFNLLLKQISRLSLNNPLKIPPRGATSWFCTRIEPEEDPPITFQKTFFQNFSTLSSGATNMTVELFPRHLTETFSYANRVLQLPLRYARVKQFRSMWVF